MMTRFSSLSPGVSFLVLSLAFALALGACGSDDDGGPAPGIVPDFALTDVNPNSATFNTEVSPRDYRERISAWYFGSST
ncbi:MAG: hypothetical protein SGI90_12655 [Candidatus Eisenbacteria bacterium]|nr:hypothetical protein [Candidatus Eisenbacteria bacterium]